MGSVQCSGFISPIMNPTYQSNSFTVQEKPVAIGSI